MAMRGFGEGVAMPVFHFTFHAYRSWNTDHPRGYVQRGEAGVKSQNRRLARARDGLSRHPRVTFEESEQAFLVDAVREAVQRRGWELYGVAVIENHLHFVVGWREEGIDSKFVQGRVKRALGYLLAKERGTEGVPLFSRGGVPEPVRTREHLMYLVDKYFPGHGEAMWRSPRL